MGGKLFKIIWGRGSGGRIRIAGAHGLYLLSFYCFFFGREYVRVCVCEKVERGERWKSILRLVMSPYITQRGNSLDHWL